MRNGVSRNLFAFLGLALLALGFAATARADPPSSSFSVVNVGGDTLVLERRRSGSHETEGVVVDAHALVETLKVRVLEARGLGEVAELHETGSYGSLGRSRAAAPGAETTPYVFSHRFSAPFQSLDASLRLRPLAEPDEGALAYPLMGLLAGCIVLGLYALYRMTATRVQFAERRNDFVSAVSHELKTPLTAIRMHAEMLQEDLVEDDARRHEYYRTITGESERLTRLIDNVLQLSRLERSSKPLHSKIGDIRPVVRETLELLRPHAEREGFRLELETRGEPVSARFEPDALRQILFNLVDNAVKYGRDATDRRITVCCEEARDGGVRLAVRDRGPGVQREHLKAVFEPFFRGERELTRKNQGTGIGLSLVKELIESMGGRVRGANANPGFQVDVEFSPR